MKTQSKRLAWLDWLALALAGIGLILPMLAYAFKFWIAEGRPLGDQNAWAHFGSFVGGIASPMVADAAVLLVFNTLMVLRHQNGLLEDEVKALQSAREDQKSQVALDKIDSRIATIWTEWKSLLKETNISYRVVDFVHTVVNESLNDILYSRKIWKKFLLHARDPEPGRNEYFEYHRRALDRNLPLIRLYLGEFNDWMKQHESADPDDRGVQTRNFYSLRIAPALARLEHIRAIYMSDYPCLSAFVADAHEADDLADDD